MPESVSTPRPRAERTLRRFLDHGDRQRWLGQFLRYAAIGVTANAASYLVYYGATTLGASPTATISVLYPLQVLLSFLFNRRWAFKHEGRVNVSLFKYLVAYAGCYLLNVAALQVFVVVLGLPHLPVQAVAMVVLAVILFIVQRYWVFRQRSIGGD